jgi:hypothetical protein
VLHLKQIQQLFLTNTISEQFTQAALNQLPINKTVLQVMPLLLYQLYLIVTASKAEVKLKFN